jgi:hypothetical protein
MAFFDESHTANGNKVDRSQLNSCRFARVVLVLTFAALWSLVFLSVLVPLSHSYMPSACGDCDDDDKMAIQGTVRRDDRKTPSEPLCDECLRIVQMAEPVDLGFVDVSGGHGDHPHMGATDADGTFGYVHDEAALRRDPPPVQNGNDGELREACRIRDDNYKMLTEKVFVDVNETRAVEASGRPRAKILCTVFTIEPYHHKIPAIRETWG